MARRQTSGQMRFDLEVEEVTSSPSTRMPKLSPAKMYDRHGKLHTPYVFTEETEEQPREWIPVTSTRVAQVRYDDGNHQVQVVFNNGVPWVYEDVPAGVYDGFVDSPSKGRYINAVLNDYPYRRATPLETARWGV